MLDVETFGCRQCVFRHCKLSGDSAGKKSFLLYLAFQSQEWHKVLATVHSTWSFVCGASREEKDSVIRRRTTTNYHKLSCCNAKRAHVVGSDSDAA